MDRCPICNAPYTDDQSTFCNDCGAKRPPAPKIVICKKCGAQLTSEDKYCDRCGEITDFGQMIEKLI